MRQRSLLRRLNAAFAGSVAVVGAAFLTISCGGLEGTGPVIVPTFPGPFVPCATTPLGPFELPLKDLTIYLPRSNASDPCEVELGAGRPLALLYPALGAGNNWGSYGDLGEHLASHGIVMASLDHDVGIAEAIEFLDEIGVAPSPEIALIGHSAGGDLMVQRRGDVASSGGDLRAVVLMAPRVSTDVFFDYSLSGAAAFLGLHWTRDSDPSTWGAPAQGPRRSVFRIYDRAGIDFDDPFEPTLWKHFALFDYIPGGHLEQERLGLITYTTAMLRRQLLDDTGQDAFLESMNAISGLPAAERPIAQQHSRRERLQIATFEESSTLVPPIFDDAFGQGVSFTGGPAVVPAWSDPFSPHDLGVMRFNFVSQADVERAVSIILTDEAVVDVSDHSHLSFRIAQEYHPTFAPTGEPVVFDVSLQTTNDIVVPVEEHGGPLSFPVVVDNLLLDLLHENVDATKNAMRTYLVPLSAFEDADLTRVGAIKFDFTRAQTVSGRRLFFAMDDVEFVN